jgi:hypothetical protein
MIVAFRRYTLLSLDDCLYAVHETNLASVVATSLSPTTSVAGSRCSEALPLFEATCKPGLKSRIDSRQIRTTQSPGPTSNRRGARRWGSLRSAL